MQNLCSQLYLSSICYSYLVSFFLDFHAFLKTILSISKFILVHLIDSLCCLYFNIFCVFILLYFEDEREDLYLSKIKHEYVFEYDLY